MTTNQEGKHASFRAISGTSGDYNGDAIAAMLAEGATGSGFNGLMISWLQIRISDTTITNLNDLQASFAIQLGFTSWGAVNAFPAFEFSFTVDSTLAGSASGTFIMPTISTGSYACDVFRNGVLSFSATTFDDANWTMTGLGSDDLIRIEGTFEGIQFNNGGDKAKIQDISAWGSMKLGTNEGGYFYGCSNLTVSATDTLDTSATTIMTSAFRTCTVLVGSNFGSWDTSAVTDMSHMFRLGRVFNADLSGWDVSSVTNMSLLFGGAWVFNADISGWDVSSVTNMAEMFGAALVFDVDISGWDVQNVTLMNEMFTNTPLFNADISGWDVGKVTAMNFMFFTCPIFNADISGWDVQNVTNMAGMLKNAPAFDRNLGNWNVQKVTNMTNMLADSTLSTANYDTTLIGWEGQVVKDNVTFSGGNSTYSAGAAATARADLIADHTWSITDGGAA